MTTLLIDADIFAFKAASACEGVYHFGGTDGEPAVAPNLDRALDTAKRLLEEVATKLKATRLIICLTDEDNFRTGVYPDYKGNRKDTRKPSTLREVKDFFAETYETYQRPGLEADDCMGILSTHKTLITGTKIIVSEDKDMQTIPGLLYNPAKDKDVRKISVWEADRFFMEQTITGDPTDGYPGCPGHGKKSRFVPMLDEQETLKGMWDVVKQAYAKKGFTAQDALVQARCARILRSSDWDFANKRVRLWCPPY
jgi:DNA polymerase-1